MTQKRDDMMAPDLRHLRHLPTLMPDDATVERVRRRCHAAIARRQVRVERSQRRASFGRRMLEQALMGGLALTYLVAVILDVVALVRLK